MSAQPDPRRRVELAQAQARSDLAAVVNRGDAWRDGLSRVPVWALLGGAFLGGAVIGRLANRLGPSRAMISSVTALGPLLNRVVSALMPGPAPPIAPEGSDRSGGDTGH